MFKISKLNIYNKFLNGFKIDVENEKGDVFYFYRLSPEQDFDFETIKDKILIYDKETGGKLSTEPINNFAPIKGSRNQLVSFLRKAFIIKLKKAGYIEENRSNIYHTKYEISTEFNEFFSIYEGFKYRFNILNENIYFFLDPKVFIKMNKSIEGLSKMGINISTLNNFQVVVNKELEIGDRKYQNFPAYLLNTNLDENNELTCDYINLKTDETEKNKAQKIFMITRTELLQEKIVDKIKPNFNLIKKIRLVSMLDSKTPSKDRFTKMLSFVEDLKNIFPIKSGHYQFLFENRDPIILK